jgi:NlpC/P60 family putative phage cell wall peptidase
MTALSKAAGARIVAAARDWLGTPYHHGASVKGVGCDCLGLVRGIWRETCGPEPEHAGPYTASWYETSVSEKLLRAADRHFIQVGDLSAAPGQILIFRLRSGMAAKHMAIMSTLESMIHAQEGAPVSEVHMSSWWRRRIAGVYAFPDGTR